MSSFPPMTMNPGAQRGNIARSQWPNRQLCPPQQVSFESQALWQKKPIDLP